MRGWALGDLDVLYARFDRDVSPSSVNGGKGWTREAAVDWLIAHGLRGDKAVEEPGHLRFRQTDEKVEVGGTVSDGLPAGVLIVKAQAAHDPVGMRRVDGEEVRGKALRSAIEVALPAEGIERRAAMRRVAKSCEMSLATLTLILQGKVNCPTQDTLARLSEALDVPTSRLLSAAQRDGCRYDADA